MIAQTTDRILLCYRIGDPHGAYPIYDATGARLFPGRWNTVKSPLIYTSEYYSTAMLEKLVHANSVIPPNQHCVRITIPIGTSFEVFQPTSHPGWGSKSETLGSAHGDAWFKEQRSAILIVPSIPARIDRNFLINPGHPDAAAITHDLPYPIWWDERLFG